MVEKNFYVCLFWLQLAFPSTSIFLPAVNATPPALPITKLLPPNPFLIGGKAGDGGYNSPLNALSRMLGISASNSFCVSSCHSRSCATCPCKPSKYATSRRCSSSGGMQSRYSLSYKHSNLAGLHHANFSRISFKKTAMPI